jgi:plastocyanin
MLALGFAANADACDSSGKKVTIKVKVENGQPVVDQDSVKACEGDTVRWIFAGGSKPFKVQFMGGDSPFDWPDGSKSDPASVEGTVKPGAAKDGQSTPYPYEVDVDGVPLDPRIIVEP